MDYAFSFLHLSLPVSIALCIYLRSKYLYAPLDDDYGMFCYYSYFKDTCDICLNPKMVFPPLLSQFIDLIFETLGCSPVVLRAFTTFYYCLSCVILYAIVIYTYGIIPAASSTLLFSIYSSMPHTGTYSVNTENFYPLLLLIGFHFIYISLYINPLVLLLSGVFFGMSFLFKPITGIYPFMTILYLILSEAYFSTILILVGVIAVILFYSLLFFSKYKLSLSNILRTTVEIYKTALSYTYENMVSGRSIFGDFKYFFAETFPLWLFSFGGITFSLVYPIFPADIFLFIFFFATILCILIQKSFWDYHFMPLVFPLSIFGGIFIGGLVLLEFVYLDVIFFILVFMIIALHLFIIISSKAGCFKASSVPNIRKKKQGQYKKAEIIGKYIKERTNPSDYIYIWGWFTHIYLLCKRRCSSKFVFNPPALVTQGNVHLFNEIISDIALNKPVYLLIVKPTLDVCILSKLSGLVYLPEKRFGNHLVLYKLSKEKYRRVGSHLSNEIRGNKAGEVCSLIVQKERLKYDCESAISNCDIIRAKKFLNKMSRAYPLDIDFAKLAGIIAKVQGETRLACLYFEAAFRLAKTEIENVFLEAEVLGMLYQVLPEDRKPKFYKLLEEKACFHPCAMYVLAEELMNKGNYEESKRYFEQLTKKKPVAPGAYVGLMKIFYKKGDLKNAIRCYRREVMYYPKRAHAPYTYAYLLETDGRVSKAVNFYKKAISLPLSAENRPFQISAFYHLGKIFETLNDYSLAAHYYKCCLFICSDHKAASCSLEKLKDYDV